jgi:hypothetical protein
MQTTIRGSDVLQAPTGSPVTAPIVPQHSQAVTLQTLAHIFTFPGPPHKNIPQGFTGAAVS